MHTEKFNSWISDQYFDEDTRRELSFIIEDEKEIEDRFYKDLEFGTGGLRGIIGAGTNRINKYTVGRATQGLANFLINNIDDAKGKGVVIAYDSRHKSFEFAQTAALVLAANGIRAYVFESLRTTPELSFAVRELGCCGGIVITASHNPPEYNGYKVYDGDGCQVVDEADDIIKEVTSIVDFSSIKFMDEEEAKEAGLLHIIGEEIDRKFIAAVKSLAIRDDVNKDINIVYTPLHGTGLMPVTRVLEELGYNNIHRVEEQSVPDPEFSTLKSPNPEEKEAFTLAMELGDKVNADILLATDPDCDRVGVVVRTKDGGYQALTGNQTGALLVHYVLSSLEEQERLPLNGAIIKTIVTSEMGADIARGYGMEVFDVLTGFKYIGQKIRRFEEAGDTKFLFGYEESYGYLAGTHARDKDAVVTSMLISEMAAYYKSKGKTLYDAMMDLYKKYGYYMEDLKSITLKGKDGMEKINEILSYFRHKTPRHVAGVKVTMLKDYNEGMGHSFNGLGTELLTLPKSNVLYFTLEDGSWFCIRPSGTEPKIKFYFGVKENSLDSADKKLEVLKNNIISIVEKI